MSEEIAREARALVLDALTGIAVTASDIVSGEHDEAVLVEAWRFAIAYGFIEVAEALGKRLGYQPEPPPSRLIQGR